MRDLFISSTSYSANKIGDVVILMEMYLKKSWQFYRQWWLMIIDNFSSDLAFWIVRALGCWDSSWIETFSVSREWSNAGVVSCSVTDIHVTIWIVGAWLRGNSCWVFVTACWSWSLVWSWVPLWGRLLPLVPLWGSWFLPLVPLLSWSLVWCWSPMVGWRLVVEDSVITDWEVGALAWINTSWVLGSFLCWSNSHNCHESNLNKNKITLFTFFCSYRNPLL